MNRFDRVFSTLVLLKTRRVIKAMTLSERFGISLRTVYRDVRTLKNAGVSIIGDPGIGYSITDGYCLLLLSSTLKAANIILALWNKLLRKTAFV